MEALLHCMKEEAGATNILLIDESARLGGLYQKLTDNLNVEFADAGAWDVALTFDGVHFSPEGHAAFAEGLIASLKGL